MSCDEDGLLKGEREIWRNEQWRVTNMTLEELPGGSGYWIARADLTRPGWIEHMYEKNWVDRELFTEAYRKACEIAGITQPVASAGYSPAAVHHPG